MSVLRPDPATRGRAPSLLLQTPLYSMFWPIKRRKTSGRPSAFLSRCSAAALNCSLQTTQTSHYRTVKFTLLSDKSCARCCLHSSGPVNVSMAALPHAGLFVHTRLGGVPKTPSLCQVHRRFLGVPQGTWLTQQVQRNPEEPGECS